MLDGRTPPRRRTGFSWGTSTDPAAEAHRLFVGHVEEALGAHAFYAAAVACTNCGATNVQSIAVSIAIRSEWNGCAWCGVTGSLVPNNEVYRDEARAQSWS